MASLLLPLFAAAALAFECSSSKSTLAQQHRRKKTLCSKALHVAPPSAALTTTTLGTTTTTPEQQQPPVVTRVLPNKASALSSSSSSRQGEPTNAAHATRGGSTNSRKTSSSGSAVGTLILVRHGQSIWNVPEDEKFTGWTDVPLTSKGELEAALAGKTLSDRGVRVDVAFTSLLQRASRTLELALAACASKQCVVRQSWRLNERHYGALQGLNKEQAADEMGRDLVREWRRSWEVPPPVMHESHPLYHDIYENPLYQDLDVPIHELPRGESVAQTAARLEPYWFSEIAPAVREGRCVMVVAHANSLRALLRIIFRRVITDDQIRSVKIPTGVPLVYRLQEVPFDFDDVCDVDTTTNEVVVNAPPGIIEKTLSSPPSSRRRRGNTSPLSPVAMSPRASTTSRNPHSSSSPSSESSAISSQKQQRPSLALCEGLSENPDYDLVPLPPPEGCEDLMGEMLWPLEECPVIYHDWRGGGSSSSSHLSEEDHSRGPTPTVTKAASPSQDETATSRDKHDDDDDDDDDADGTSSSTPRRTPPIRRQLK